MMSPEDSECGGFWCDEWGKCEFSKQCMKEDPAEKEAWLAYKREKRKKTLEKEKKK